MSNISDYLYRKASMNKIPLNGCFELSPVCNFSCKMCYVRKTAAQIESEGKKLTEWTKWLELAKTCRQEGMLFLLLTGGEPFIYPHFRELYEELHKLGILLSINSNGTMIDRETVEWLKESAPMRVNITPYGASAETYGRVCGNPGGYERAVNAIRMLKEAGISVVVNASMIPENADDLEQILAFGKEMGINVRMATYMFPPTRREQECEDSRFTAEVSAEMYCRRGICQHGREIFLDSIEKMKERSQAADPNHWGSHEEFMKCRAGRSSFWVSWDGTMTACGMLPFPLEAYPFEEPFKKCWLELTNKVRTTPVLRECVGCDKEEICRPCVAMMYSEVGDVNRKAPYLCRLAECIVQKAEEMQWEGYEDEK